MSLNTAYEPEDLLVPGTLPPAYGSGWAIPGQLQPAYGNDALIFDDPSIGFDSRITFTRSTVGRDYNSAGTLRTIAIDVARANANQDYNPSTLAARGFLIEAGATNLLLRSQEFDNASWTKIGATVTANSTVAPDGTTTADTITNTDGATSLFAQSASGLTPSSTQDYYPTIFVKRGNTASVTMNVYYESNAEDNVTFNLDTLAVSGEPYAGEYIIEPVANGFYRIGYRITRDATASRTAIAFRVWGQGRGTGVIGDTVVVWGADLKAQSFATSYIATTTASVARGADNATISTLSSIGYNQAQGTLYAEFSLEGLGTSAIPRVIGFNDGTDSNGIEILVLDNSDDKVYFFIYAGGVNQVLISTTVVATAFTTIKAAASWQDGAFRLSVNGVASAGASSGTIPTVTQMTIGRQRVANYLNGWVKSASYIPQALSQSQLNAMTA